jgi:hypothetical protein
MLFGKEYSEEIGGVWKMVKRLGLDDKVTHGMFTFFQLFYELLMECTGIVAQHPSGHMLHGRNMDIGLDVPGITATVTWIKGGKEVAVTSQYLGYFGVHTGMRVGGWSVQANERVVLEAGPWGYQKSIVGSDILALLEGHQTVGYMLREALLEIDNFEDAVEDLAARKSVSPLYFIMAGAEDGQGAVLTKNRKGLAHSPHGEALLRFNETSDFYLAQTNWDNWIPIDSEQCKGTMAALPPRVERACAEFLHLAFGTPTAGACDTLCKLTSDGREEAAKAAMNKLVQEQVSDDALLAVLSTPPVYQRDTQITALMHPATGDYTTIVREHHGEQQPSVPEDVREAIRSTLKTFMGLAQRMGVEEIVV